MADAHVHDTGKLSLTAKIMIAMGLGILVGVLFDVIDSEFIDTNIVAGFFGMIGTMFVNALKMLVVPLVFFSLMTGVTGIGDIRVLGRVGGKSFALYMFTTACAIGMAIILALLIGPGAGFDMEGIDTSGVTGAEAPSVWATFAAIVPTNPIAGLRVGRDAAGHLLHRDPRGRGPDDG